MPRIKVGQIPSRQHRVAALLVLPSADLCLRRLYGLLQDSLGLLQGRCQGFHLVLGVALASMVGWGLRLARGDVNVHVGLVSIDCQCVERRDASRGRGGGCNGY